MFLGGIFVAEFFEQASLFDFRRGHGWVLRAPGFEHGERFLRAVLLDEQHRQAAASVDVVRVVVEALAVITFGLGQIDRALHGLSLAMVVGRQVVIAIGIVGIGLHGLAEALGGAVEIALLEQAHAFGVLSAGHPGASAGGADQNRHADGRQDEKRSVHKFLEYEQRGLHDGDSCPR